MSEVSGTTQQIQNWLDMHRGGDERARRELTQHAYKRLEKLASHELRKFPALRSLEETGSILHEAIFRLEKALEEVQPETTRQFFKLASQRIRWLLLDLKKRLHHQVSLGCRDSEAMPIDPVDSQTGPATRAERREIHEIVDTLPDELREIIDLRFYQALSEEEVAGVMEVSYRTVRRRWRDARVALAAAMGIEREPPPEDPPDTP